MAMIPIPFVSAFFLFFPLDFLSCLVHPSSRPGCFEQILFLYGAAIRRRSKVSRKILALTEETRALREGKADEA